MRKVDHTGRRFNRITVLSDLGSRLQGDKMRCFWLCRCDCGNVMEIVSDSIGKTQSCGCGRKETLSKKFKKHGRTGTLDHHLWLGIKAICYNKNNSVYKYYGGRGISMSEDWRNSFERFMSDMGDRPSPKHSIDRIDVNGNYELANCRWATQKEQKRNTRVSTRVQYMGNTAILRDLCDEFKLTYGPVYHAIKRHGYTFQDILDDGTYLLSLPKIKHKYDDNRRQD